MKRSVMGVLVLACCAGWGCKKGAESTAAATATGGQAAPDAREPPAPVVKVDFPGTAEGARALLGAFVVEGADVAALSRALRPQPVDYAAVFVGEAAKKAQGAYAPAWDANAMRVEADPGQTEVQLWSATGAELAAQTGDAAEFPGGYRDIAAQLGPDVAFYRFRFVRPGETAGRAFDGLVHVNGRWVIFPKPYRALR